jgi:hypothetical protein
MAMERWQAATRDDPDRLQRIRKEGPVMGSIRAPPETKGTQLKKK